MNENRFFLWTKIFIKIKARDKMKCSQKNFMGGGQFSWGKINHGKCLPGKLPIGNLHPPPSSKEKREKKKKIGSMKYYLLGKMQKKENR